jgi:putative transposase
LTEDGEKSVLGLWIEQAEGAKFWLKVVNELKARGVNDILIDDGLKGFPEAITSVFPQTVVQTCIVHLIRNSLAFVSWKDRKAILPSIKAIYRAENADMALVRLEEFEAEWGKRYPAIGQAWRRAWEHVVPFFAFAPGIRKMIYTTNAVEALHRSLRKIIKTRGSFPNDDATLKLLYLAILNAGLRWRRGTEWSNCYGPVCHPVRRASRGPHTMSPIMAAEVRNAVARHRRACALEVMRPDFWVERLAQLVLLSDYAGQLPESFAALIRDVGVPPNRRRSQNLKNTEAFGADYLFEG